MVFEKLLDATLVVWRDGSWSACGGFRKPAGVVPTGNEELDCCLHILWCCPRKSTLLVVMYVGKQKTNICSRAWNNFAFWGYFLFNGSTTRVGLGFLFQA